MSLQFIDHSKPFTDVSRRRIRRHAAKGHNAGRTINRASKALTLRHRPGDLFEAGIRARTDDPHGIEATSPCALVGNNLGCAFPAYVSAQFQPLMRRCVWIFTQPLVTTNLGKIVEHGSLSVAPMWIEMMFVDKGYYHIAVAACLIAINNASQRENLAVAYRHFGEALRMINAKLSTDEAVADSTIATVVMALQYERYRYEYLTGIAHLDGLLSMVALRGGAVKLYRCNPALAYKVFRVDLDYAMYLGTSTRFSLADVLSSVDLTSMPPPCSEDEARDSAQNLAWGCAGHEISSPLLMLFADMKVLATHLNDSAAGRRPKLNVRQLREGFLAMGYRLTAVRPFSHPPSLRLGEDALYAGMACSMNTLLPGLDGMSPKLAVLRDVVRRVWSDERLVLPVDEHLQRILLWLLFAGETAALFQEQAEQAWVVRRVRTMTRALGLRTWQETWESLADFMWVECIQDETGLALWTRAVETHL